MFFIVCLLFWLCCFSFDVYFILFLCCCLSHCVCVYVCVCMYVTVRTFVGVFLFSFNSIVSTAFKFLGVWCKIFFYIFIFFVVRCCLNCVSFILHTCTLISYHMHHIHASHTYISYMYTLIHPIHTDCTHVGDEAYVTSQPAIACTEAGSSYSKLLPFIYILIGLVGVIPIVVLVFMIVNAKRGNLDISMCDCVMCMCDYVWVSVCVWMCMYFFYFLIGLVGVIRIVVLVFIIVNAKRVTVYVCMRDYVWVYVYGCVWMYFWFFDWFG